MAKKKSGKQSKGRKQIGKFAFEFLSIFIAVISAFWLNHWNDNRRDNHTETKILQEISRGLEKDIEDIKLNIRGHRLGIRACVYWRKVLNNEIEKPDSVQFHFRSLTRDYITIQNGSGYESLKSKGLDIIKNDSLRSSIISLQEYDFNILTKFEEEYYENQFQRNYFQDINYLLAPNFAFDSAGQIVNIEMPIELSNGDKKRLFSYLWKIQSNREFILRFYAGVEDKIKLVIEHIQQEVDE